MSLATDLLSHARGLAIPSNGGRPRQADLRRSVSTAYYALFHFLGEGAATRIIGAGKQRSSLRKLARRSLIHGKMKNLCDEFTKPTPSSRLLQPFWISLQISSISEIVGVAGSFRDLQQLRHEADYDLTRNILRIDAIEACEKVGAAMDSWSKAKKHHSEVVHLFCVALLLWPSLSQR